MSARPENSVLWRDRTLWLGLLSVGADWFEAVDSCEASAFEKRL